MSRPASESAQPESASPNSKLTLIVVALMAMLVLSVVLNYIDRQTASTLAPTLKQEFGLSTLDFGWANSAFSLIYIFSSVLGGLWVDRVGVRKGLLISTLCWSIAAAGHSLVNDFWSLCFWRMVLAAAEGPGLAAVLKGARRLMPPHLRDTGLGIVFAGSAAGALIAPLVMIPLELRYGWQAAFLASGGFGLIWTPIWLLLAFGSKAPLGPDAVALKAGSDVAPQKIRWSSYSLWAALLTVLLTVPPTVFTNNYLSLYLNAEFGLSQDQIKGLSWQPFLALDMGQLAGGFAAGILIKNGASFLNARTAVMSFGFLSALAILGMNNETDPQRALIWLNVSRFCFQCAYTVLIVYGIESATEGQTALMSGLMNGMFSASNLIFNPIIGRLADDYGYHPVIVIVGILPVFGLAGWIVLSRLAMRQKFSAVPDANPPPR